MLRTCRDLRLLVLLTLVLWGLVESPAIARPFRVGLIPNGAENRCANCHVNPAGGGSRDLFGQDVEGLVSPRGREEFWDAVLAAVDSDEDGFTNGQELGDIDGDGVPERTVNISLPGDADASPVAAVGDCNLDTELSATDLACVENVAGRNAILEALSTVRGDLDGNGDVAFADFLILSNNFGNESVGYAGGDINLSGRVDFADFLLISDSFGFATAAEPVPEPSGTLIVSIGAMCFFRLRSSRKVAKSKN